ncbi:cell division protein FtsQ/DivIB [Cellulomonas triticagri]|nr:cell division protein FtsQ/DivIB [Cellulomonas triticagri]
MPGSPDPEGTDDRTAPTPRTARTAATPRPSSAARTTPAARATGKPRTAPTDATPTRTGADPRRTSGRGSATPAEPGTELEPRTGAFPVRPPVVSQGSAARFAERARARRMLAWRQIVGVVGGVVVVGALAWLLLLSPVLALDPEQVRVDGAGTVVAVDQVRAVVDEHTGVPLPRLDVTGLRTALLDVPGVRDVTLSRDWPRGLSVQLVSREPVAAVPEAADVVEGAPGTAAGDAEAAAPGYALVDQDGVKVGRSDTPPEGLPVVEVPVGEARILAAALGVLESLPDALLADIGQVSAGTQDTVRFVLRDGATVEWGSAQEPDLKAAVLSALRAAPETAGSSRYDVSAPTMPVVG